jgi:hypothetical protein
MAMAAFTVLLAGQILQLLGRAQASGLWEAPPADWEAATLTSSTAPSTLVRARRLLPQDAGLALPPYRIIGGSAALRDRFTYVWWSAGRRTGTGLGESTCCSSCCQAVFLASWGTPRPSRMHPHAAPLPHASARRALSHPSGCRPRAGRWAPAGH